MPRNLARRFMRTFAPLAAGVSLGFTSALAAAPPAEPDEAAPTDPAPITERGSVDPRTPADEAVREALGRAPEPVVVESLGLALYRPEESIAHTTRRDGQSVLIIEDAADIPRWRLTMQHLHTGDPEMTAEQQVAGHIEALEQSGRPFDVISNEPFTLGGTEGRLCYVSSAAGEQGIVNGWLILPAGDGTFLVGSLMTMPQDFEEVRPVVEASFRTIRYRSAVELSLERRSHIEAGRRFLQSLTQEQLKDLVGLEEWTRIYRPAGDGRRGREIGYSRLQVERAPRGALNPERSPENYGPNDRTPGLLVRLQGRVIGDREREIYFDSLAMYWMAWDQSEEQWSVRGTQRQRDAERGEAETGIRLPQTVNNPRPMLTVIRATSDYMREPHEWPVPDVYLSQALGTLLGRLLLREIDEPIELAYYFYHQTGGTPQLTRRLDRWSPDEAGADRWKLQTRLSADAEPVISYYTDDGEFVRRERPDGTVAEPVEPDELLQLWERRGLETGRER